MCENISFIFFPGPLQRHCRLNMQRLRDIILPVRSNNNLPVTRFQEDSQLVVKYNQLRLNLVTVRFTLLVCILLLSAWIQTCVSSETFSLFVGLRNQV